TAPTGGAPAAGVVVHAGRILAVGETGPPLRLDPHLVVGGTEDFGGALAEGSGPRPRRDPVWDELVTLRWSTEPPYATVTVLDVAGRARRRRGSRGSPRYRGRLPSRPLGGRRGALHELRGPGGGGARAASRPRARHRRPALRRHRRPLVDRAGHRGARPRSVGGPDRASLRDPARRAGASARHGRGARQHAGGGGAGPAPAGARASLAARRAREPGAAAERPGPPGGVPALRRRLRADALRRPGPRAVRAAAGDGRRHGGRRAAAPSGPGPAGARPGRLTGGQRQARLGAPIGRLGEFQAAAVQAGDAVHGREPDARPARLLRG
ncbi:MAG: carotenoid oxygenase family protein, partial [Candidatus Rokubacteria bacterium]|nr:carotenoid oxygenase family protein [Candidatus Rokubacteria bacterium]